MELKSNTETPLTEFVMTKPSGEEMGYIPSASNIDMDIGETNDFEMKIPSKDWDNESLGYGCRIFAALTEYGGIIRDIESVTSCSEVILRGATWRGMLQDKVVEPPDGEDHLVISGDLNKCIGILMADRFGGLFRVPDATFGITAKNWKVDRFAKLYDALDKMLKHYSCRMQIRYIEPEDLEYGYVEIQAAQISDYSDDLEYGQDGNVYVDVRDCRSGVNHLICIGEGEGQERVRVDLFVQEDGSIGKNQYYFGLDEIEEVYNYTSADAEKLEEDGIKRLQEVRNYKKCQMTIGDADLEIGDIVSGYDAVTDTAVKKPITRKIIKVENERISIEYEIKGDD